MGRGQGGGKYDNISENAALEVVFRKADSSQKEKLERRGSLIL